MNYRLSRNGQEIGVFSLEEIQQRRAAGEFTGGEFVWANGMTEWKPLNSVIPPILTVNGQDIFQNVTPPQRQSVTTNEFYVGLASPIDSRATIRYRNLEIRSLRAR
ncbi:MAG TPA: DUF4339 domain-containing protein [Verrucomicrobiae bacterium]